MSIVVGSGAQLRSTGHLRGHNSRNIELHPVRWSVAHNFLVVAISGIDMRRSIADLVGFKEVLAMEHEADEVDERWSAFGRPFLNITSEYAMRIR